MSLTDKHKKRIREILKITERENRLMIMKQYLFSIQKNLDPGNVDISYLAWQIIREHSIQNANENA